MVAEPKKCSRATNKASQPFGLPIVRCLPVLLLVLVSCGLFMIRFEVLPVSFHVALPVPVPYLPSSVSEHLTSSSLERYLNKTSVRYKNLYKNSSNWNNTFTIRAPIRNGGFLQATKPSDDYVINLDDIGPRDKIGELFIRVGNLSCLKYGMNNTAIKSMSNASLYSLKKCPCGEDYHGHQCSIPGCVYKVVKNQHLPYQLLSHARRVVMAFPVNHEFDMVEIRVRMLANVVDVFIIAESNVTARGGPKPLRFFEAFRSGFLAEFQHKILYVYRDHFPPGYVKDGWKADRYIRTHMSKNGVPRIIGLSPEDIFLLHDADEIPKEEAVRFLKMYKGYPQPIRINMRHSYYGYFYVRWKGGRETMKEVQSGSTVQFLSDECNGDAYLIRLERHRRWKFEIGVMGNYGGHHCSWCHTAEGLRQKLLAHQLADNQNANYDKHPNILDLKYLESLRRTGFWFDGTRHVVRTDKKLVHDIAPLFVLQHRERYKEYLIHPDNFNLTSVTVEN